MVSNLEESIIEFVIKTEDLNSANLYLSNAATCTVASGPPRYTWAWSFNEDFYVQVVQTGNYPSWIHRFFCKHLLGIYMREI